MNSQKKSQQVLLAWDTVQQVLSSIIMLMMYTILQVLEVMLEEVLMLAFL